MRLSFAYLLGISVALLCLAVVAPPHIVFLSEFPLVVVQGNWDISGVLLNPSDLVLGALLLAMLFRRTRLTMGSWPLRTWLLLGVLMSLAYSLAPTNQRYMTDLIRIGYQLYRYAWKFILFFPLAILLLGSEKRVRLAITSLIVGADLCAVSAVLQGLAGYQATGPFSSWNALGGVLQGPLLFCVGRVLLPRSGWDFAFSAGSLLLIARALLYGASRGSIASFLVGCVFMLGWMWSVSETRQRLLRLAPLAVLGFVLLLTIMPNVAQRPNIQRAMTIRSPTEVGTFQWRVNQRWPHFWKQIAENPWFGVGTDVDLSLGREANTPHNGYMSVALLFGVPVALLYLGFALRAIGQGVAVFRNRSEPWLRVTALNISSVLVGILTHNLVDSMFVAPFVGNQFWMLCGVALLLFQWPEETAGTRLRSRSSAAREFD